MGESIRVLTLGTGQMGSGIARQLHGKAGLELVGAYGRREARASVDLGRTIGLDRDLGIPVDIDLDAAIGRTQPHIAIQATCSTLDDARDEIVTLLRQGVHVISIAEEMAYPAASSPSIASELHSLAAANGVSVLGTGINPGFMLDLLVIALTGVCAEIESISARRVNDLSPYGHSVLTAQGVGMTPDAFREGVADGTVTGHIGFLQSIHMIAATLGWDIERIEETREPIVSQRHRETPFITVEPGQTAGCLHTAQAFSRGKPVITLVHPQQIHPEIEGIETGDSVKITGTPNIRLAGTPEVPGGIATMAIAVNMIPRVLNASPGLHTMADLPVPAAIMGDARTLVRSPQRGGGHG
jgi:4-hydroxy-tetrahydrodipicolinate reductase